MGADMPYGIWCIVSGGVTGRREAWLKVYAVIIEGRVASLTIDFGVAA
jgi:hypothetical protein